MKRIITASTDPEEEFWNLYDGGYNIGMKLQHIIEELGYDDDFFPDEGDPTADDDQYAEVLDKYYGRGGEKHMSDEAILETVMDAVIKADGVSNVRSFEDAGMLTNNKGFIATIGGKECQFEWLGSY